MPDRLKLFFHVQHLLGIGHQMRAAALARACAAQGLEVHYVSGGFPDRDLDLGGAILHQLPPVRIRDADFAKMVDEDGQLVTEAWWDRRREACLAHYDEIRPDVILLEGYPFARRKFGHELLPLIDRARADAVPVATSLRDILVTPKAEKRRKSITIAQEKIDLVLVHGDPALLRIEDSFPGAEILGPRLFYSGFVDGGDPVAPATDRREGEIVVSVGGGAVGQALIDAALAARDILPRDNRIWRILLGPNLPENYVSNLKTTVLDPMVILEPARPDFRALLAGAALSISQAGYNTVMDILAARCPALLVPFSKDGENEQPLRARLLAERGLAHLLAEAECSAERLAATVAQALATPMTANFPFALTGAAASASLLKALAERKRGR